MKTVFSLMACVFSMGLFAADDDGVAAAKSTVSSVSETVVPSSGTNAPPTRITAKRMEYDYKEAVALFDEDVVVTDPKFRMTSEKMIVFFQGTNEMKQLVVIGNVSISNDNRIAVCEKAVYTKATGQIVMTGKAALQRVGQGEDGKVTGDRITIWVDEERIEVYPGATLTLPGGTLDGGKGKKGISGAF